MKKVKKAKKEKVQTMQKEPKKRKRFSLSARILLIAIVAPLIVGVAVSGYAARILSACIGDEVLDGLGFLTQSVAVAYDNIDSGAYALNADGDLVKGSLNITKNDELLKSFTDKEQVDLSVFYGDVRKATTINGKQTVLGGKADAKIAKDVLKGKVVKSTDAKVEGKGYYACYRPIKASDGKIVGMIFAGEPSSEVNDYIVAKALSMNIVTLVLMVIVCAICFMIVRSFRKGIKDAQTTVGYITAGDLTKSADAVALKRNDEIGDILCGIEKLRQELLTVMEKIHGASDKMLDAGAQLSNVASQSSSTADEISRAVEDISKGAIAQADEIENASGKIEKMGQYMSYTVDGVGELDMSAGDMKNASDESEIIIRNLDQSNNKTMAAIDKISKQVVATNESANKISEAVDLISAIAEETNLLSLNASIEAARAGEQGRGFAVVANQIQKLAEQSNESAGTIADIIEVLLRDSETTVSIMQEVQKNVNEQKAKLDQTKEQFVKLGKGIDVTRDETENIKVHTNQCNNTRGEIIDTFSSLSAISEENAASTQETTASMQELNATINLLAEEAEKLQTLSKNLDESIQFFKV